MLNIIQVHNYCPSVKSETGILYLYTKFTNYWDTNSSKLRIFLPAFPKDEKRSLLNEVT